MKYRSIAGMNVSVLGLGAANFGGIGSSRKLVGHGDTEAEAHELLDCAVALGINLVDTAGTYGAGASEEIIGSWLASRGPAVRDRVVVSSKVGIHGGLGRENVRRELDSSLARLRLDHLDLFVAHVPDPATPWDDVLATMRDLAAAGKIRAFGISNVLASDIEACARAASDGGPGFASVQNAFNLLERDDTYNGVLDACRAFNMTYTPYSPLAGGLLTGKYVFADAIPAGTRLALRADMYGHTWTPENAERIEVLKFEAAARSVSPVGLATWWVLNCDGVTSVLVGPRRPEQLERMVTEALWLPVDPDLWRSLAQHEVAKEKSCITQQP
jgi:aryl-alcohol dehydrogenase-like predicted oxidoreductase